MDLISTLEDESVQLVVTSPPYAEQRKGQYRGVPEAVYPDWTVQWMALLWDKLAADGSVLIVIRPHITKGCLSDYVLKTRLALRDDGWTECEEMIWFKPDAPPLGSNRRPRRTWESILWFGRTGNPYINLTACGRESQRVGFVGSFRFGVGGDSPVRTGQTAKVKGGISRCADVFPASIGSIEDRPRPSGHVSSLACRPVEFRRSAGKATWFVIHFVEPEVHLLPPNAWDGIFVVST